MINMNAKKHIGILVVTALLLTVLAQGIGSGDSQAAEDEWNVVVDEGENHKIFRFSSAYRTDAVFGIRWGSEDAEGALHAFSMQNRCIAVTSAKDESGKQMYKGRPVRVNSILATRLHKIFEYDDMNGNGLWDFVMEEDGKFVRYEPGYKYIDLSDANWRVSEMIEGQDGDNLTWEFTLIAKDLPYYDVSCLPLKVPYQGMENESLDYFNLTFHLTAGTTEVEGVKVPNYQMTMKGSMEQIEKKEAQEFSGVVGNYEIKWDHEIVGWDFEPNNENSTLLMSFGNIVGNRLPPEMSPWQHRLMNQAGEDLKAEYRDTKGEQRTNLTTEPPMRERKLLRNRISYGGNWSRMGRFTWVSDVTVDGEDMEMYAQIVRGSRVVSKDFMGRTFVGFAVHGGLNYPGGDNIFHDPGIDGSAYLEISSASRSWSLRNSPILLMIVSVVIIVVLALLYRDSGKKTVRRGLYDSEAKVKKDEWSNYYDRD
ncbi:MAG: hypothetical protein R6U17_08155 [Thermoplasmata archaeon]